MSIRLKEFMKKREWKTATQWRLIYNWAYGNYLSYWDVLAMIKSGELQAEKVERVWRIYTTPAEIFAKRQKYKK